MIYLLDFNYRVFYSILASILCILYLYIFLNDFIFIFTLPSLAQLSIIDSFIFTEPKEIFLFKILICIFYFFISWIPYFIILIIDYFKSGFYKNEWLQIRKIQFLLLVLYYICNFFSFFIFLPIFWSFFLSLATKQGSLTLYFFELSALNYYSFLFSTHLSLLIGCLLIISFSFFIYFCGIKIILKIKSYLIIIILFFSTIITPPDVEFQICLFFSLYICLEFFFFILFLRFCYLKFFN